MSELEMLHGIFNNNFFPNEGELAQLKKSIWKLVNFGANLSKIVANNFEYKAPDFQKN